MFSIDLQHNYDLKAAELTTLERKQMPFAFALACTRTASRAQAEIVKDLPNRFTLRNQWVQKGIKITSAKKTDPEPRAIIYSKDEFMYRQEEGGTKEPEGKALALPVKNLIGKSGYIAKSNRPAKLLSKYGYWVANVRKNAKLGGIFHRVDARKRKRPKKYKRLTWGNAGRSGGRLGTIGREREPVELVYVFIPRAEIDPRFGFEKTVITMVDLHFSHEFENALDVALRTAR